MERCDSPTHCSSHAKQDWMFCVMCRTRKQSLSALRRAQTRTVSWPDKSSTNQVQPVKDLSSCTIDEALHSMVQYLGTTTRSCKKYYNGQSDERKNRYDRGHCSRFHVDREPTTPARNPLLTPGLDGMNISVAPGTYSISAGQWGGSHTQTHVVKLSPGQSANLDFVF